ncbi:hypothetical protein FPCIR_13853 [Fusarium pseudocircinatum]|uniref:Uncharacterized protein n=1 Tax=Fusarium pseudocircinatum TaxID=56676 RepID=A0A8H5NP83_9HYPO|nr:hypothetical protein FPCIR_13853 [Fusarium pseudocircinatum]
MTSNNRDLFPGEGLLGDDSPLIQRAIAVGKTVADLVKESKRSGEASAHSRLTSSIDLQDSVINALGSRLRDSEDQNADLSKRLEAANKQVADLEESLKASQHRAAKAEAITNGIQASVDRGTPIINHVAELVSTIAETVEELKRNVAARLAETKTHAQKCKELRDKIESLIRRLYRERGRHVEMLGLARKHTGSVANKLIVLLDELEKKTRLPDKTALAHCLQEMLEELAEYRNKCDGFLDNGLADNNEPDRVPVPNDEGGALLNESYGKFSRVASANNTEERTNQPRALVSPGGKDAVDEQASREESSLFIDDQHRDEDDQSCTIKSEDGDNNQQALADLPPSTKRASNSGGRAGRGAKRQRTK